MIRKRSWEGVLAFSIAALVAFGVGCTDTVPPVDGEVYLDQTSPDNVLINLQTSYKFRNIEEYAKLLADDFLFFFDPVTQEREQLPEFWNRFTDSVQTDRLFNSPDLIGTKIKLTYDKTPREVNESGREHWVYIDVGDTFLEVELGPTEEFEEGVTLLVDGQTNRFYFRKGRTEADTLAESATSQLYYITEWKDRGASVGS
jgi:hypothetical protein